jgi:hypothetical protein
MVQITVMKVLMWREDHSDEGFDVEELMCIVARVVFL